MTLIEQLQELRSGWMKRADGITPRGSHESIASSMAESDTLNRCADELDDTIKEHQDITTFFIAIREQQQAVASLIAKYRESGGDDLFFAIAALERQNEALSNALALHLGLCGKGIGTGDSVAQKPAIPPFDPALAPPGDAAVQSIDGRCIGCRHAPFQSYGCQSALSHAPCGAGFRPDKTDAIFIKKETP